MSGIGLGVVLLGLSALFSAVDNYVAQSHDRERIAGLEAELECRSLISASAQNIEGRIKQATALGLVAVARNDDAALEVQAKRIERLARELGPALDRRANAVEECAEP